MAPERAPAGGTGGGVRLFVALELPPAVRSALVAWCPRDAALRPVPAAGLHVTLCFLGRRPAEEVPAVSGLVEGAAGASGPVGARLGIGPALWLPSRRPRVLALELADPGDRVAALQGALSAALARGAGYVPERRPFHAHVTVARVRAGAARPRPEPGAPPAVAPFAPAGVTLFRSHLGPAGASYEALGRWAV